MTRVSCRRLVARSGFGHDESNEDSGIRTGEYKVYLDSKENPAEAAVVGGIYNEDMAVSIVDEVEKGELTHKHWSCAGPIDVKGQRW